MSRLLNPDEINRQLSKSWSVSDVLSATFEFDDFAGSLAFVDKIGAEAESMNHHPDIDIRWNKVVLTLSTHDAGGITQLDVELARRADQLFAD